jgi:hypothetical protein
MSRGDLVTLSGFVYETFSILTTDPKRLSQFASDLLDNAAVALPLNVRDAAIRALRW